MLNVFTARITATTDRALEAFWSVVADDFPEAATGDLSPLATFALSDAATSAVTEWVANNCR